MRWLRPLVAAAAIALGLTQGAQAQAPFSLDGKAVAAMRTAFDAMVADPAFLAATATLGVDLKPRTAADLTAAVERLHATPDATIAEIGTILLTD